MAKALFNFKVTLKVDAGIEIKNLSFAYGEKTPEVLHIENFKIAAHEKIFLFGPSGSGKTSLLGLIAGVLSSRTGDIKVLGKSLSTMPSSKRDEFRGDHIGYIFQMFNLIPYLSVLDNIELPTQISKYRRSRLGKENVRDSALELSKRLGLDSFIDRQVTELSVGQQQRVAVARALLGAPEIVIADEPTSALDTDHRQNFIDLLFEQCKANASTLIFVSHDRELGKYFDRQISLAEINLAAKVETA